jgi:hypothetical protein
MKEQTKKMKPEKQGLISVQENKRRKKRRNEEEN